MKFVKGEAQGFDLVSKVIFQWARVRYRELCISITELDVLLGTRLSYRENLELLHSIWFDVLVISDHVEVVFESEELLFH